MVIAQKIRFSIRISLIKVTQSAVPWCLYLAHLESFKYKGYTQENIFGGTLFKDSCMQSMVFQVTSSLVESFFSDIDIRKSCSGKTFVNVDDQNYRR